MAPYGTAWHLMGPHGTARNRVGPWVLGAFNLRMGSICRWYIALWVVAHAGRYKLELVVTNNNRNVCASLYGASACRTSSIINMDKFLTMAPVIARARAGWPVCPGYPTPSLF